MGADWKPRLELAVADGLAERGAAEVRTALETELYRLTDTPGPAPLEVDVPVLGVDASPGGWVGVLLVPDSRPVALASAGIAALVELARESAAVRVVAIDIPIGLPDRGGRQADVLARRALAGRASSVFATLTRSAYAATTYAEGRTSNLDATGGLHSASAQAYALRTKILEVDEWVRARPGVEIIEVHPELSYARLAGHPLLSRKKTHEGAAERRDLLRSAGLEAPAWFRGSGFGEDDLLDACAAAWTAVRHARRESEALPPEPEVFSDGLPAAIWV